MANSIFFQRVEAAFLLVASIYFYNFYNFSFLWFAILLFTIDLFMAGYLINERIGAYIYNLGHSLAIPITLLVFGTFYSNSVVISLGLIWLAHIGLDRVLGYGLKNESGFKNTHLGHIGGK